MSDDARRLADNLARVRSQIDDAAQRSGRHAADVTLVAVTKYVDASTTRLLAETGCLDLGESRPQQLWQKSEQLSSLDIRWHMIGHLQRNKVDRTVATGALIHSIDSQRLLRAVNQAASAQQRVINVLLEVNISGDATKHGLADAEVEPVLDVCAEMKSVRVCGLMAMAGLRGDADAARGDFQRLRQLRDSLGRRETDNLSLRELSMGMSGDFVQAIEEGATIVRVGSALFAGISS